MQEINQPPVAPRLHQQNQGHLQQSYVVLHRMCSEVQQMTVVAERVEKVYSLCSTMADLPQPLVVYRSLY